MLERLSRLFRSPPRRPDPLPEPDARLAMGTLLVRVAQADGAYLFEEIAQIDRILAQAYGLNPVQAAQMRATCERLAHELHDDAPLIALIRDGVDYDSRRQKVAALWQVVMADGLADEHESALMDLIEAQLGVDRADSEAARAAAVIP